jgi:hypothetical protein
MSYLVIFLLTSVSESKFFNTFCTIIYKPNYQIPTEILKLIYLISERIGEINTTHFYKHTFTLEIDGNTLIKEQIAAVLENKTLLSD